LRYATKPNQQVTKLHNSSKNLTNHKENNTNTRQFKASKQPYALQHNKTSQI